MPGHWVPDEEAHECDRCFAAFSFKRRRHHCRDCGGVFCDECCGTRAHLAYRATGSRGARVCLHCLPFIELYHEVVEGRGGHMDAAGAGSDRRIGSASAGAAELWINPDAYERKFARPSAVGIKRRSHSSDDLAASNFSIVPEVVRSNVAGDRQAVSVPARGFPEKHSVFAHPDVSSMLDCGKLQPLPGAAALRFGLQQARTGNLSAEVEEKLLVADFASYY